MRRFLRFRLSTLLLAVVSWALALAWWKDREEMRCEREAWQRERHEAALLHEATQLARRPDVDFWLKEADYRFIVASLKRAAPFEDLIAEAESPDHRAAAWQELVMRLSDPSPAARLRAAVTAAKLSPVPPEAEAKLLELLEDQDDEVRTAAIYLVRLLGEPSQTAAVPKMYPVLGHPQAQTRLAAFLSIVYRSLPPESLSRLLLAFEREPDQGTRRLMAAALCRLREK